MREKRKVNIRYFSVVEFVSIFAALVLLSALPALMYGRSWQVLFSEYTVWYLLYWLLVAAVICAITAYQKHRRFSYPLKKLSEASQAVAQGDFSVYIEPLHTSEQKDYMDIMFEDFNQMVKELGSIETLKNDVISNVSHELKTPLAIIQNYAVLLRQEQLSEAVRKEYLSAIEVAIQKLNDLITNILKLNKLENQEISAQAVPFDLCRQLSECILHVDAILEQRHLEVDIRLEDRCIVTCDEELLEIVWNNLLSNAVKYTEDYGTLQIVQTSDSDSVQVEIRDSGCGMDAETMKHIFDKFYQGDTSHSQQGNGLGLALAYRIIEKCGGTISVSSTLKEGSTFYVQLPVLPLNNS